MTPQLKIRTFLSAGNPSPASNKAHQVGHNNSNMPIGLSKRIRRQ
jgi:hypothetical protein